MARLQSLIHKLEEGSGLSYLKYVLFALALLLVVVAHNWRQYKNLNTLEAMDTAQLARNMADGKGYKTLFVRPFSVYLLEQTYTDKNGPARIGDLTDRAQIKKTMHPDLANPPVYPFVLAGLMKIAPGLQYQPAGTTSLTVGKKSVNLWNNAGHFWIYPPDFWIGLFNQMLLLAGAVMVFFLARKLFDPMVAWTSAALFLGTDLFWRFSMAGISTMLVVLVFFTLAWCLSLLEEHAREAAPSTKRLMLLAVAIGALVGIGCLTRYAFGWLIIPVIAFVILFLGQRRVQLSLVVAGVFALLVTPWIIRNYQLSHTFFGTAGYAVYETTTPFFPDFRLLRSLNPDLHLVRYQQVWAKSLTNAENILQNDLPRLGGNWLGAFFLVGLLLNFKNLTLSRLRYFVLLCLPVLVVAQAMGRTQLSEESPVINTENLLVFVAPLVIIFGVSLFYILLDQIVFPFRQLRFAAIGAFCFVICFPGIVSLFLPRSMPIAYPPYFPPAIQQTANWMKEDELMMSDIPWAVAWYGKRQCLWLTLNSQSDFLDFSDYRKTVSAIYLTPVTMDSRFLSQWVRSPERSWGSFVLLSMLKNELPPNFPLTHAPVGFLPEQFFLTDTERWAQPASTNAAPKLATPPAAAP